MLNKDSARCFGIADLLQKIFQRHQPSRRKRPWQWEGHLPERMSWRFSVASYQEASTGLGGRNQTNRASTEIFLFKKTSPEWSQERKVWFSFTSFVGFCVSKISIWFCQQSCKAIQKWNGKPPLKVRMRSLTEMISPTHIFWDQEKNKGSKKKCHHVMISPSNHLFWRDQQKTILLWQSRWHCPWTEFAYCRQHFMTWHQCHDRI